jgi:hypothetical protein
MMEVSGSNPDMPNKPNSKSVSLEGEVLADEPLCNVASAYRGLDTNYAGQYNEDKVVVQFHS